MTKGTKIFRIIISILLALTMIISAFFATLFYLYFSKDPYGIYVAGVSVNRGNDDADIFCSGAVVNRGATFDGEIDALGGIHSRD